MKKGLYFRLAKEGILKNKKLYFPYILTCICMIMMFYIVAFLSMSADIKTIRGGEMLQGLLSMGIYVIAIFAVIFLYYTNSFLIRRRKKEFGLYHILGMGKRNIVRILIWENVIVSVVSLGIGIISGILFSKMAELAAVKLLGGETGFYIHVATMPVISTIVLFVGIFLIIMLRMLFSIYKLRPVEMLRSESVGEKPPRANWIFALAGAAILYVAYYMAVKTIDPISAMAMFLVAVVLVIIATYLLFIAGSVALCKLLQKNKKYYYKTKHFVSLSQMAYRMKRNGASLASICILSTMVLVTVSSTMCIYADTESNLNRRYPQDIYLEWEGEVHDQIDDQSGRFTTPVTEEMVTPYKEAINEVLAEYGETGKNFQEYRVYPLAGALEKNNFEIDFVKVQDELKSINSAMSAQIKTFFFIPLDDYNRLKGTDLSLAEDEMLLYADAGDFKYDSLSIENVGSWTVSKLEEKPVDIATTSNIAGSYTVVVKDLTIIENISRIYDETNKKMLENRFLYPVSIVKCYGFDINCGEECQIEVFEAISQKFSELHDRSEIENMELANYSFSCRAYEKGDFIAINGGLFFLGILLGSVFLFGTVLIMYYKQISEGYEDQDRFNILKKVGMTEKEVKKSINSQVLTVFFAPLIMAGIHLAFAFPMIEKILRLMSGVDVKIFIIVTVICYLVFALFYVIVYVITSKSYYGIISGKK